MVKIINFDINTAREGCIWTPKTPSLAILLTVVDVKYSGLFRTLRLALHRQLYTYKRGNKVRYSRRLVLPRRPTISARSPYSETIGYRNCRMARYTQRQRAVKRIFFVFNIFNGYFHNVSFTDQSLLFIVGYRLPPLLSLVGRRGDIFKFNQNQIILNNNDFPSVFGELVIYRCCARSE